MKKYRIGYTQGTFDLFHIGHLNLLKNAKKLCEKLIVGVNTDKLSVDFKNKKPIICEDQRIEIVKAIKYVDMVYLVEEPVGSWVYDKFKCDAVFIGDDWKGSKHWSEIEKSLTNKAEVVYLKRTEGISSSQISVKTTG